MPKLLSPDLRNAPLLEPRPLPQYVEAIRGGSYSWSGTAKTRPKMGANRSNTSAKTSSDTLS